jgi:hypothetical protein
MESEVLVTPPLLAPDVKRGIFGGIALTSKVLVSAAPVRERAVDLKKVRRLVVIF